MTRQMKDVLYTAFLATVFAAFLIFMVVGVISTIGETDRKMKYCADHGWHFAEVKVDSTVIPRGDVCIDDEAKIHEIPNGNQ